jgi:hypothetical protein
MRDFDLYVSMSETKQISALDCPKLDGFWGILRFHMSVVRAKDERWDTWKYYIYLLLDIMDTARAVVTVTGVPIRKDKDFQGIEYRCKLVYADMNIFWFLSGP